MEREFSYSDAGVDIKKIKETHKSIASLLKETFIHRKGKFGEVLSEIGHYAGLIDIGNNNVLALHVDGVGTKLLVAQMMNKYDTIGVDCVAMCVNDIICLGAEPISLIDYLAIQEPNKEMVNEIMKGLVEGAKQADIAIIGGETATIPEIIKGYVKDKGFDLVGMCVGIVNKDKIITGEKIEAGDIVIGLESNGLHSNGYTLCRKVLFEKYTVNDKLHNLKITIGEELIRPTRIYVNPILEILKKGIEVHGLAHITGGAFTKLRRLKKGIGYNLNNIPKPPTIFEVIKEAGNISYTEMYKVFNMGIGFCIIAPKEVSTEIVKSLQKYDIKTYEIGYATEDIDEKIRIQNENLDIVLN